MAHGIALAGRLDLDDLGTHVAEQLAAERSCDERAELQHAKVGERAAMVSRCVMAVRVVRRRSRWIKHGAQTG